MLGINFDDSDGLDKQFLHAMDDAKKAREIVLITWHANWPSSSLV